MSVTAEIETRYRTNVLAVPIASVTTRLPKEKDKKSETKGTGLIDPPATNSASAKTNAAAGITNALASGTNQPAADGTNVAKGDKKKEAAKPIEVVFVMNSERAKMVPVKIGISDDSYWEITEGVQEGQEVISGGYRAISKDLEDGKRVRKGPAAGEKEKEEDRKKKE